MHLCRLPKRFVGSRLIHDWYTVYHYIYILYTHIYTYITLNATCLISTFSTQTCMLRAPFIEMSIRWSQRTQVWTLFAPKVSTSLCGCLALPASISTPKKPTFNQATWRGWAWDAEYFKTQNNMVMEQLLQHIWWFFGRWVKIGYFFVRIVCRCSTRCWEHAKVLNACEQHEREKAWCGGRVSQRLPHWL